MATTRASIVGCERCGTKNRVPASAPGAPKCDPGPHSGVEVRDEAPPSAAGDHRAGAPRRKHPGSGEFTMLYYDCQNGVLKAMATLRTARVGPPSRGWPWPLAAPGATQAHRNRQPGLPRKGLKLGRRLPLRLQTHDGQDGPKCSATSPAQFLTIFDDLLPLRRLDGTPVERTCPDYCGRSAGGRPGYGTTRTGDGLRRSIPAGVPARATCFGRRRRWCAPTITKAAGESSR